MKMMLKVSVLAASLLFMLVADIPILPLELVPDAEAILGVRRRTRRRTAVVVGSATAAATAAQTTHYTTTVQQPAPQPAATGNLLPQGTVVTVLPAGCSAVAMGGTEYQLCAGNYYRAAFQGNNLVYVVQNPQ